MKKSIKILSLLFMVVVIGSCLSGCAVSEEDYETRVKEGIKVYFEDLKSFNNAFGELNFEDEAWGEDVEGKADIIVKTIDKLRKIKAPKKYSEEQGKINEASKKIKQAMKSYKKIIGSVKNNADLFEKESQINEINGNIDEASKLIKEVDNKLKEKDSAEDKKDTDKKKDNSKEKKIK